MGLFENKITKRLKESAQTDMSLDKEFEKYIYQLQKINEKYRFAPEKDEQIKEKKIAEIGKIIYDKDLLDKCKAQDFASQLLMKNDVPRELWGKNFK